MKRFPISIVLVSFLLVNSIVFNLVGCSSKILAQDLMIGISPNTVERVSLEDETYTIAMDDFSIRLFQESFDIEKNTLISPLSVLYALGMTANGAQEETLKQMEEVLRFDINDLNRYLHTYKQSLNQDKEYKLSLANSIWFTQDNRFKVNPLFLQTNADFYGADIYRTPFDAQTLKDINNWVNQNTNEMIPEIIDSISPASIMYLVNALAFEAEWDKVYESDQVNTNDFTKEDGTYKSVEFMYSTEGIYLADENATGFMKYYKDSKCAFVAMLPNKGVTVSEYINTLDGKALNTLLTNLKYESVDTSIPKFESKYNAELSKVLSQMGMENAFDALNADFGGIGTSTNGNIHISRVLHKTFISVGEKGTKAGAATAVELKDALAPMEEETKKVYLNRPFVYMLVDTENNIPFFIGTMMDIEQ